MLKHFFENLVNISSSEVPRLVHGWLLRFFLGFGFVIGWTSIIATVVSRFSIGFLPVLFLIQALLTIAGMMIFSIIIGKFNSKQVIILSTVLAILMLGLAYFFYDDAVLLIVFALIASGVFLPQVNISLSSLLEDNFTPLEAERVLPAIESAKTIGGILGGILLASLGFSMMGSFLILFWIASLVLFLLVTKFGHPELPFYLKKIDDDTHKQYSDKLNLNGIAKSIKEISRLPFLQILITVLLFHWIIAYFLEFLYTKAVDESVQASSSIQEHEVSLAHGLGALHVFFHSSALFVELFVAGRFVRNLGVFAGFVLHALMTLMSAVSLLFGYGYVTAVLARNNFEITSIIQTNSYETSYYAFKYGTLRAIREFFEGFIFPIATIIATLLILGIELFFLEAHFMYILPFMLVFFGICMGFFSIQLKKKYTTMALQNSNSDLPIAQHHAIEIISQKGHKESAKYLYRIFKKTKDVSVKEKVVGAFAHLGDTRASKFLCKILRDGDLKLYPIVLESLYELGFSLKRTDGDTRIRTFVANELEDFILRSSDDQLSALAVRALSIYDSDALIAYLSPVTSSVVQAEAAICLWEMNLFRKRVRHMINKLLESKDKIDLWKLVYLASKIKIPELAKILEKHADSADFELRLISYIGLIKMHRYNLVANLINLLLYGNTVIFKKGLELIMSMNSTMKRKIAQSLMPVEFLDSLPSTESGRELFNRLKVLYGACGAYDEKTYIDNLILQSQKVYNPN